MQRLHQESAYHLPVSTATFDAWEPGWKQRPSGKDCWTASDDGYAYKDRERTPNGMFNLKLKAGTSGKAKITAKAGKTNLDLPSLGSLSLPLRVQLQRAGTDPGQCWETVFTEATSQTATKFKAKSP